jgi:hypothetical protein
MQKIIIWLITLLSIGLCKAQTNSQKVYRENSLMPVSELLNTMFHQYEIVFLGESHRIRQQVQLVSSMIPILQKQGVHVLFSEFANYADTRSADSLLTAKDYDEELVFRIIHRCEWDWAYQEYADIYKAAWTVNKHLRKGEQPFRIIGLQPDLNYSVIQKPEDWDNVEKRKLYWNDEHNSWLNIIETEAISKNRKALVHCGLHHAFTKFHHPVVIDGKFVRFDPDREGTRVYNKYPGKVATIVIYNHHPGKPDLAGEGIRPFHGVIDSITQLLPSEDREFGFMTNRSTLGNQTDTCSFYSMGYGILAMKNFCDAVIVAGPVCNYVTATLIEHFVNEKNLENTIIQAFPYSFKKDWTVQSCNDSIRKWREDESLYLEKIKKCK